MTTQAQLRNRYAREQVTTASPAKLVTMLYDRLLKDLNDAEQGLGARDIPLTHNALVHAQDIVRELSSSLDVTVWAEAANLQRLYAWVLDELMAANLEKNAEHVQNARDVIEPLAEAWHEVARQGVNGERP